ncbi:MAG TPA: hypothetical protein VGJ50_15755 [Streptosporangiaceae bacterium]
MAGCAASSATRRSSPPLRASVTASASHPVSQVSSLTSGRNSAYVLTKDGLIYTWGSNVFGQLGNGTTQGLLVPTLIPLPAGVAAAALVPESGSTSAYLITAPGGRNGR